MNFVIWLILGGTVGWAASLIMDTNAEQGIVLNIIVGIVGALLGGWLGASLFGAETINDGNFSIAGLGVSLLGAVVLLAMVRAVRGRRTA